MEAALTRSRLRLAAAAALALLAPSILRAGSFDRLARATPYGRIVSDRVSAK